MTRAFTGSGGGGTAPLQGTFANRPGPSQVRPGTMYFASDVPWFMYLSNGTIWQQFAVPSLPAPPLASSYTVLGGAMSLSQQGDSIRANCWSTSSAVYTCALQAGLSGLSTFRVVAAFKATPQKSQYPEWGVAISNGLVNGTSAFWGMGCYFDSGASGGGGMHSVQAIVGADTRTNLTESQLYQDYRVGYAGMTWAGILADNGNLHFQVSRDGVWWDDWATLAQPGGMTDYGFFIGNGGGGGVTGQAELLVAVNQVNALTVAQQSISGAAGTPIQLTMPSTAGLKTGDLVSVQAVGGNTNANATRWPIQVVDGSHLNLLGSTTNAAYTSGGVLTLTSR